MNKVKVLMATGVAFPAAVKAALGTSIRDFAAGAGVAENTVSALINGSTPNYQAPSRQALADALGVEREWIDEQIENQRALYQQEQVGPVTLRRVGL